MKNEEKLTDIIAERAVLSGIYQYGEEGVLDVIDILQNETFTDEINQAIYKALKHLYENKSIKQFDHSSLLSALKELQLDWVFERTENIKHVKAIINSKVKLENIRTWAAQIRKLQIARLLHEQLQGACQDIQNIKGSEPIAQILGIAESAIFDFSMLLDDKLNEPEQIGTGLDNYLKQLEEHPVEIVGISSGLPYYDKAIGGGFRRKTVSLIGARQKALRYGSKVYTRNGPINIEKLKIGDKILNPDNQEVIVTQVHDHKNIDIYRVYFKDGDYVDCCGDHLWHVYKRYPYNLLKNKQYFIQNTVQLSKNLTIGVKKNEYKWDIKLTQPIEYESKPIELDPYILGILIGDGSFGNSICFAVGDGDEEIVEYIKNNLKEYDIKIDNRHGHCTSYRINGIQNTIRKLGLFKSRAHHKFIPKHYIYNSIKVRTEILRGLMDTDGNVFVDNRSKNPRYRYTSVSLQLVKDIKEIVQSLGGLCSITNTISTYLGKKFKSFTCEIRLPSINPFKLKRKAEKYKSNCRVQEVKRTITKIEKIGIDNARCVSLNTGDGLFLTDNYVITHNTGKSMLALNIALHSASKLQIPTLILDTEMSLEDQWIRLLPNIVLSENKVKVGIDEVETGQYSKNEFKTGKVHEAAQIVKKIPYYYMNVSGKPFEEVLSIIRKWIKKYVGQDETGRTKDCLIIYDYLKMMTGDSLNDSLREYQVLGFMTTAMHNFAVRYDVPFLTFTQLNRDGIDKESSDVIAGSDRVLWLATNFTVYKIKSDEEIAENGPHHGNRKLVPICARHGAGMEQGDYINILFDGKYGKIWEGETRSTLKKLQSVKNADIVVDIKEDEQVHV